MTRFRPLAIIIAVIVGAGIIAYLLLGSSGRARAFNGYIEGEDLYLAAPVSGTIASISAVEGQRVTAGEQLFRIDPATLAAPASIRRTPRPDLVRANRSVRSHGSFRP